MEQVYILGRATSQGETAPGYMFFYEPTVSRVHAELRWNEKKKSYFVHHQSKTNPTLVEGLPVDKKSPRPLEKGHKIQMGYLVLEMEPLSIAAAATSSSKATSPAPAKQEESAKTHKMMVGNILEALSNLSAERGNTSRLSEPRNEPRNQPRAPEPESPKPPSNNYLERDYGASDQTNPSSGEIQFTVAQGPDKGEVFVLKEQVGILGRALGRDDPRKGQGVLLHDDSLPKEAAYVVWQSRDQAYGLSESDNPGVAIRVRRVQQGNSRDLPVGNGPPVLLQDGDIIQLGRSALVCRVKGGAAMREWSPTETGRSSGPLRTATPQPPAGDDWAQPSLPSPWGRPAERPGEQHRPPCLCRLRHSAPPLQVAEVCPEISLDIAASWDLQPNRPPRPNPPRIPPRRLRRSEFPNHQPPPGWNPPCWDGGRRLAPPPHHDKNHRDPPWSTCRRDRIPPRPPLHWIRPAYRRWEQLHPDPGSPARPAVPTIVIKI